MKTAPQRETEFLQQCIRYDATEERHRLGERLAQIQRDVICVRRAAWLMALLAALALAGLGYAAIFTADYPLIVSQLTTRLPIKALGALGGGSVFCLFVFLGIGAIFRMELDKRREDCRRLALKVLESRLGQLRELPAPELVKERETIPTAIKAQRWRRENRHVQNVCGHGQTSKTGNFHE